MTAKCIFKETKKRDDFSVEMIGLRNTCEHQCDLCEHQCDLEHSLSLEPKS